MLIGHIVSVDNSNKQPLHQNCIQSAIESSSPFSARKNEAYTKTKSASHEKHSLFLKNQNPL